MSSLSDSSRRHNLVVLPFTAPSAPRSDFAQQWGAEWREASDVLPDPDFHKAEAIALILGDPHEATVAHAAIWLAWLAKYCPRSQRNRVLRQVIGNCELAGYRPEKEKEAYESNAITYALPNIEGELLVAREAGRLIDTGMLTEIERELLEAAESMLDRLRNAVQTRLAARKQ